MRKVLGTFCAESRNGTMIILEGMSDLPFGTNLIVKVHAPGKAVREATAIKDRLHSRALTPMLIEGFLLVGMEKSDLEGGTQIEFCTDAA
ncbi:hypothetical protein [Rhizobium sp. P44RR-XXIV]|uniref:hypothetical protein n=1 Tax=Rhizobium sp. P44RR-XXIV TaxID=1921145 RepID=UPI0010A9E097|nr:hypothetical protein [Rhizobium sp. P44RR-XXIV]TIX90489.1 hypothetical protein BSK43_014550 [Rhizobium sp. P44RR-XXIV]